LKMSFCPVNVGILFEVTNCGEPIVRGGKCRTHANEEIQTLHLVLSELEDKRIITCKRLEELTGMQTTRSKPNPAWIKKNELQAVYSQRITNESLTPGARARIIEELESCPSASVREILLPLLGTAPPIVQESAVLVLVKHMDASVKAKLEGLIKVLPEFSGLRLTAIEVLEGIEFTEER
jgi:hypothetical protein